MQRLLMLLASAVIIIYAASAMAADSSPNLKGTYGITGSNACLTASGGFNAKLQALWYHIFELQYY